MRRAKSWIPDEDTINNCYFFKDLSYYFSPLFSLSLYIQIDKSSLSERLKQPENCCSLKKQPVTIIKALSTSKENSENNYLCGVLKGASKISLCVKTEIHPDISCLVSRCCFPLFAF